jgi:hypothetical protein
MPFDLVWTERTRDRRWLWLRKKEVRFQTPITTIDMRSITVAMPIESAFLKALEAEIKKDGWGGK